MQTVMKKWREDFHQKGEIYASARFSRFIQEILKLLDVI